MMTPAPIHDVDVVVQVSPELAQEIGGHFPID
jgi:hypothetical protein